MNYIEAELFMSNNKALVGKKVFIPTISDFGKINQLIVAPARKCLEILMKLTHTETDNKTALSDGNLMQEDLLIYVIAKDKNGMLYPMNFYDYLKYKNSTTNIVIY